MAILFETHESFNAAICSFFAGTMITAKDPGQRAAAATNFRRLYKTLDVPEKKMIREATKIFREDPRGFMKDQADLLNDIADDDNFLDQLNLDDDGE